jgi:hypothetical protein
VDSGVDAVGIEIDAVPATIVEEEEEEEQDGVVVAIVILEAGRYYIGTSIAMKDLRSVVDCSTGHSRPDSRAGTEPSLRCNQDRGAAGKTGL